MKTLLRAFSVIHALMAALFACAALMLIMIAGKMGWFAFVTGLNHQAAQGIIEAVGLLAAAVVALQIARLGMLQSMNHPGKMNDNAQVPAQRRSATSPLHSPPSMSPSAK